MANSTLTLSLVGGGTATVTVVGSTPASSDPAAAKLFAQQIPWNKGVWADDGKFYPIDNVVSITVNP